MNLDNNDPHCNILTVVNNQERHIKSRSEAQYEKSIL